MATLSNSGNKELSSSHMKTSQGHRDNTMAPMSTMELKAPVVEFADMKQEYKDYCFQICEEAFRTVNREKKFKDMAESIKGSLDERFGGSWHVCVGKEFGNFVTYESHTIILFRINHISFLIWKFG